MQAEIEALLRARILKHQKACFAAEPPRLAKLSPVDLICGVLRARGMDALSAHYKANRYAEQFADFKRSYELEHKAPLQEDGAVRCLAAMIAAEENPCTQA